MDNNLGNQRSLVPRSLSTRLSKLPAEILPLLLWGSTVWHMRAETISTAGSTVVRMARMVMHDKRPAYESWSQPRGGSHRVTIVVTCAVTGAGRMATRPACSVV